MQIVISAVVVLAMFVGIPLWLAISLRRMSFGEMLYGDKNRGRTSSGIGNALLELDRILARPSIEYRIQAEDQDKLSEDETGGE